MSDYKPGLYVATVRGVPNVRVFRTLAHYQDTDLGNGWWPDDDEVSDVRPLVVLDLSLHDVEPQRMASFVVDLLRQPRHSWADHVADQIEAQTRSPKPAEPTGLGAVVEDSAGRLFVRTASDVIPWLDADDTENGYDYADLDAVRVLSKGVRP